MTNEIDWTKPLEHVDGTPLILADIEQADPDYYLRREDGGFFTAEQREGVQSDIIILRPDGTEWMRDNSIVHVRNRAEVKSKWGAEIEVNGVRPDWLRVTDIVDVKTGAGWRYPTSGASDMPPENWAWTHNDGSPCIDSIRLPADHPFYLAQSKGFTYWPGGDAAPGDWAHSENEKTVLLANGEERYSVGWWDRKDGNNCSVIGYKRRALPVAEQPEGDTVTIARMTEGEACVAFLARQPGQTNQQNFVESLRRLGLIRNETRAERFTRQTGFRVTPDVEAALEWERG